MSGIEADRGFAEVAGTRLYYEVAGAGPALVLIHGFTLDTRFWDAQFAALSADFRVLRYDLRGFGRSATPDAPYAHTDDLAALMQHLGIERAVLGGLSMGGWIATHFALEHPDKTRALALADATLLGCDWSPEWKSLWREIYAVAEQSGIAAAKRRWLEHPIFAPARRDERLAARLEQMVEDYSGWHWLNADTHRPIDPPDIERLHEISVPTVVMTGEHDFADFHLHARILRERIRGARNLVVPDAGHLSSIERPEFFNARVRELLADA